MSDQNNCECGIKYGHICGKAFTSILSMVMISIVFLYFYFQGA